MEIEKSRQITTLGILQYDLFDFLSLLDGDFHTKLQKNMCQRSWKCDTKKGNIDFMSIIRWLPLQSEKSFNNLSHDALGIIKSIWKFHQLACSLWNLCFGIYTRIRTQSLQSRPTYWFPWYWNDIKNASAKPMTYQYQRRVLGSCNIQDGVLCENS